MSAKTPGAVVARQPIELACKSRDQRHKPDFGGKSAAFVSARQHQPDGQNPIATSASLKNTAQPWLRNLLDAAAARPVQTS